MMTILCILGVMTLFGMVMFVVEANNAKRVPSDMPFLAGDYDPEKDPTLIYESKFCDKCQFLQLKECSLMKKGVSDDERVRICKEKNWFMPKS